MQIVLVEPGIPGNIGAVARVMKNFDFKELVLISPRTELTGETYQFAMHGKDLLENIQIFDSLEDYVKTVSYVVGTTAKICTDFGSTNARVAVSSNSSSIDNLLSFEGNIALLFGREDFGLTNEQINYCDMTVCIPTSKEYPTLNLAQSVAIMLYSLFIRKENAFDPHYREATREEKEFLIDWFEKAVGVLNYRPRKEEILTRRFRNIIGRSFVSGKEAHSLLGVFSRTVNRITYCNELINSKDKETKDEK
jgi:TrmH family RNA methyltransferase